MYHKRLKTGTSSIMRSTHHRIHTIMMPKM